MEKDGYPVKALGRDSHRELIMKYRAAKKYGPEQFTGRLLARYRSLMNRTVEELRCTAIASQAAWTSYMGKAELICAILAVKEEKVNG